MFNGIGILVMSSVYMHAAVEPSPASVADVPFAQEYHEPYPIGHDAAENDVRAVAVDREGQVWAAAKTGVYVLPKGDHTWRAVKVADEPVPAFDCYADASGQIWIGAWDGLYRATPNGLQKASEVDTAVAVVAAQGDEIVALGPDGFWRGKDNHWTKQELPCARGIRAVLPDPDGALWIATGMGLYRDAKAGGKLYQSEDDILNSDVRGVAFTTDSALWAGGLGGITIYKDGKRVDQIKPEQGLPSINVQCLTCAPNGEMWVGTDLGVARFDGTAWSLRHSKRWLLNDDVRDVAFDADGTAWIATAGGVSAIRSKKMMLAEKAAAYYSVCMERHVREPWLVELCRLLTPGDTTRWEPVDDDNDGEYTSMYLAAESYRFAATKDPEAQTHARKAFDALAFLQTVTGTPGFFARTVVPAMWTQMHDPGDAFSGPEWAATRIRDPRYKKVRVRWRPSEDGKWLWKGDTSSDEVTGHFYGYARYFDLAADDADKERVRAHVRKIMDYIIDNGYVLKDIDGVATRWGVWAPEKLDRDPDWAAERGINSLEILSYLKATHHITGDEKYQREYLRLLRSEGYAENARHAKTYAPAWSTRIDDELLALVYPSLLLYETDPELLSLFRDSLDHWFAGMQNDRSPFFNFIYASLTGPDAHLDDSVAFLRDAPLDLVNWLVDNSKREDLRLVRAPIIEPLQTDRLLPASERGVVRWDKNPWEAIQGDGGRTEWCPTFWLLPYWMGRHLGYIHGAEPPR